MALRIAETYLEIPAVENPKLRIAATYLETVTVSTLAIRVAQTYIEVVTTYPRPASTGRRRRTWVAQS